MTKYFQEFTVFNFIFEPDNITLKKSFLNPIAFQNLNAL